MKTRFLLVMLLVIAAGTCAPSGRPPVGFLNAGQMQRSAPKSAGLDIDRHLGTWWYGVYLDDNRCGYAVTTREKTAYNGKPAYKFRGEFVLSHALWDEDGRSRNDGCSTYYATGELAETYSSDEEPGKRATWKGVVTGDIMTVTSSLDGVEKTHTVPAPAVTLEDEIASLRLILGDPQPGTTLITRGYSLEKGKVTTNTLTIRNKRTLLQNGVETVVYDGERVSHEDGTLTSILFDGTGNALQMTFLRKRRWEMRLEPEETARNLKIVELAGYTIHLKGRMPPFAAKRLRLKIAGLEQEQIVADSRQQFEKMNDGTWQVTLTQDSWPAQPAILPVKDPELAEFLKPTGRYQSDAPEIVAKARQIVGENNDSAKVAQAICTWVYANLRADGNDVDDALGALRRGAAGCKGDTALFVALCRAAGLPARGVVGVAYAPIIEGFGAHAWAEVYVGKWIAVDPAWGQPIATTARIKFGGEEDRIKHMERLSIEAGAEDAQQAE